MNLLEGQIPSSLSKLLALETLVLQGNLITGKLDGVFESQQDHLFMIDLSNNMITGSLPDSPFSLPSLETLVLSGKLIRFITLNFTKLPIVM
jgi:Leucine-rich repeat (LRR) protein